MEQIPDAPWIREVQATGYYEFGWWNNPPREEKPEEPFAIYDPDPGPELD